MKPTIYSLILSLFFIGCGSAEQNITAEEQTSSEFANLAIKEDTLANALEHYFLLKNALVAADTEAAKEAASSLQDVLSTIEGCSTTAALSERLSEHDELEAQRSKFSIISEDLIGLYQNATLTEGTLYVINCPMYNENEGANWLAASSEIRNPYYGDKMLSCGTISQEIH